jgi:hypothetical protein
MNFEELGKLLRGHSAPGFHGILFIFSRCKALRKRWTRGSLPNSSGGESPGESCLENKQLMNPGLNPEKNQLCKRSSVYNPEYI